MIAEWALALSRSANWNVKSEVIERIGSNKLANPVARRYVIKGIRQNLRCTSIVLTSDDGLHAAECLPLIHNTDNDSSVPNQRTQSNRPPKHYQADAILHNASLDLNVNHRRRQESNPWTCIKFTYVLATLGAWLFWNGTILIQCLGRQAASTRSLIDKSCAQPWNPGLCLAVPGGLRRPPSTDVITARPPQNDE